MNIVVLMFLLVAVLAFISLYRAGWDFRKAWESIVLLVGGIVAAFAAWWGGGLPS